MRIKPTALLVFAMLPTHGALQTMRTLAHANVPFSAGDLGASVYVGINIQSARAYRFSLDVQVDPQNPAQLDAIHALEGLAPTDGVGSNNTLTTHIPIRLRVAKVNNGDVVILVDQIFFEEKVVSSMDDHVSMTITSFDLPPGDYRVRAEALQNNRAADILPITFGVHPG